MILKNIYIMATQQATTSESRTTMAGLSTRKLEILSFYAMGYTAEDIGDSLSISKFTVSNHRKCILKKPEAKNIIHAVALGVALKMVFQQ